MNTQEEIVALTNGIKAQQSLLQEKLRAVIQTGKRTFEVAGQFYQVRERAGQPYLCGLKGDPSTFAWHTGPRGVRSAAKIIEAGLNTQEKLIEFEIIVGDEPTEDPVTESTGTLVV